MKAKADESGTIVIHVGSPELIGVKGRSTHDEFPSAHDNCNANTYDVDKQDEVDDVCDDDEDGCSDNGEQDEFNVKGISKIMINMSLDNGFDAALIAGKNIS